MLAGHCDGCGLSLPRGMERHKEFWLCPACHAACHLREISALQVGYLFYSNQVSQADASLISIGAAVALESSDDVRQGSVAQALIGLAGTIMKSSEALNSYLNKRFLEDHPKIRPSEDYGGSTSRLSVVDPVMLFRAIHKNADEMDRSEMRDDHAIRVFINPGVLRRFAKEPSIQAALWGHNDFKKLIDSTGQDSSNLVGDSLEPGAAS